MLSRPLLYLHAHAPPTGGGSPVLLHRLLSGLDAAELEIVTDRALRRQVRRRVGRVLPGRYSFVRKKGLAGNRFLAGRYVNGLLNVALAVIAGSRAARIARRRGAGWVMSVADEGFSVIAGHVCARLVRVPHVIMIFDLWEENAYTEFERRLAAAVEAPIFRRASALLVHCREMADHYRRKHGIDADVVPSSVELWDPQPRPRARSPYEVAFVGAVYWAQEDALRRLSRAVGLLPDFTLTLIGSWASESVLAPRGIDPDRTEPELPPEKLRRRLEEADVLFLGLSFGSAHPDVVRTASPAKLPEYMASGTPLLVHAPEGSHVAEYTREADFGEVVSRADERELAAALARIVGDPEAAARRARRARELAEQRHEVGRVRARFVDILERVRQTADDSAA